MQMSKPYFQLETERLFLREKTIEDAESAYFLNLDPEVIKYTGDDPFASIEEARTFLSQYTHYQTYGFGRWAVILKETGEYLGWCGLKYTPELDEYDIGYRFMKKHWGKGYATESAHACIQFGFEQLNIKTIVGRAMIGNTNSINVLKKLGLTYQCTKSKDGIEEVIYSITK